MRFLTVLASAGLSVGAGCNSGDDPTTTSTTTSASSTGAATSSSSASTGGGAAAEVHFFVNDRPDDPAHPEVETADARWADPVRVRVEKLTPNEKVRLDFAVGSFAVFTAAADGSVDLARDAPIEGSWSEADIDGPFWSAPQSAKPIFDVDVTVTDADSQAALASATFHRRPVNDSEMTMAIADGTRVGMLTHPPNESPGKHAAILVFGGSEGGTSTGEFFAYYLSQLGYVSFGVGYFGAAGLPADLDSVPLEILKDDLDFLASQPDVDPERIAVMGGSRGGELALLLGAHFPDRVHAVVAQVPSGYVWGATTQIDHPAWTLGGDPLPAVPYSGAMPVVTTKNGKQYYNGRNVFLADIAAATPTELEAARTEVEGTDGPVLLLGGGDDQLWPSCDLSDVAFSHLTSSGHAAKYPDERHCFDGAGHFSVFPPGSSTLDSDSYYSPEFGVYFVVGGTPVGNAHAERAGNTITRAFLRKALGEP